MVSLRGISLETGRLVRKWLQGNKPELTRGCLEDGEVAGHIGVP